MKSSSHRSVRGEREDHALYAFYDSAVEYPEPNVLSEVNKGPGLEVEYRSNQINCQVVMKQLEAGQCSQLTAHGQLANSRRAVEDD